MRLFFCFLFIFPTLILAQTDSSYKQTDKNFEVVLPSMLPLHPLGIFGMRVTNNFRENPVTKTYISFGISNGNSWLPQIDTYKPINISTQKQMSAYSWYYRKDIFKIDTMPAQKTSFSGDGVIQEYRLNIIKAIQKHHEVHAIIKAYRLSGKALLSFVTNDKTIEVFHALFNINDPYKRSLHQYDSAAIKYVDEKGKTLIVNDGDVFVPGTEFSYFYFPTMHSKYLKTNIGVYSGLNFSKYNAGIDFGLSATIVGIKKLSKRSKIAVGIGANCIAKKIIPFSTGVMINNALPLFYVVNQIFLTKFIKFFLFLYYKSQEDVSSAGEQLASNRVYDCGYRLPVMGAFPLYPLSQMAKKLNPHLDFMAIF